MKFKIVVTLTPARMVESAQWMEKTLSVSARVDSEDQDAKNWTNACPTHAPTMAFASKMPTHSHASVVTDSEENIAQSVIHVILVLVTTMLSVSQKEKTLLAVAMLDGQETLAKMKTGASQTHASMVESVWDDLVTNTNAIAQLEWPVLTVRSINHSEIMLNTIPFLNMMKGHQK